MSQDEFVDDANSVIIYQPSNVWDLNTGFGSFGTRNGTIHSTIQENATATFRFKGKSIKVYGLLYPTGSNVSATLDGSSLGTFNLAVETSSLANVQAIFSKDGLDSSKQHEIVLTKLPNDPQWRSTVGGDPNSHLNLDAFEVGGSDGSNGGQTTSNSGQTNQNGGSSSNPSSSNSSSSSGPPTGAIVGGVVGGVLVLALLGFAIWFLRRRRRAKQREEQLTLPNPEKIEPSKTNNTGGEAAAADRVDRERRPRDRDLDRLQKAGLSSILQQSGGENQGRTSLFELPGHRVVHLSSNGDAGGSTAVDSSSDRSPDHTQGVPFVIPATGERQRSHAQRHAAGSAVSSSVVTGSILTPSESANTFPLDHSSHVESYSGGGRADSSLLPLPSTFGPTPNPLEHDALQRQQSGGLQQQRPQDRSQPYPADQKTPLSIQESGTGSLGPTSATSFTAMSVPSSERLASATTRSESGTTSALLQELAGLREQVRQLAQLHGPYDPQHPDEPPPEYEGRDSDDETDIQSPQPVSQAPALRQLPPPHPPA